MRALIVLLCLSSTLLASPYPKVNRYDLDITFTPNEGTMRGNVGVYFDAKSPIEAVVTFFLHGELQVDSVLQGGKPARSDAAPVFYSYDYSLIATKTTVTLDTLAPRDSLRIFYSGYFNPSKARSPSDYMRVDSSGVLLRAYGYSLWFPVFLEAGAPSYATTFRPVRLTIPAEYQIIFCGAYLIDTTERDVRISPWQADNTDLCAAQCSAQRWKIARRGDITTFHYGDAVSTRQAVKVLTFAEQLLKAYRARYNRTAVAGDHFIMELPPYGDISSGNVTGLQIGIWQAIDDDIYARIGLAHELVHPFVNANVPKSDSLYALAIEGFPSYFHLPALASFWGNSWYDNLMKWLEQTYLDKKRTGTDNRGRLLPPEKPLLCLRADEVGVYKDVFVLDDRALLFMNYLRVQMGEGSFGNFCRQLFSGSATTAESFERLCGKYLPFKKDEIKLWLYTNEFPDKFRIVGSKGK